MLLLVQNRPSFPSTNTAEAHYPILELPNPHLPPRPPNLLPPHPLPPRPIFLPPMRHLLPNLRLPIVKARTPRPTPRPLPHHPGTSPLRNLGGKRTSRTKRVPPTTSLPPRTRQCTRHPGSSTHIHCRQRPRRAFRFLAGLSGWRAFVVVVDAGIFSSEFAFEAPEGSFG
jgi:hypothetical protein